MSGYPDKILMIIIRIYFIFPLLFGTYRSYLYELKIVELLTDANYSLLNSSVYILVFILYLLSFLILFKPFSSNLLMLYCITQFVLDFFFQNFIKYQTSVTLTNLFPLFCYLILTFKGFKSIYIQYIVSIGFAGSAFAKIMSGWLDLNVLATQFHIKQFFYGFQFDSMGVINKILTVDSIFFWKSIDYLVVLFELAFLIVFCREKYYKWLVSLAVIFHILILLYMSIPLFFPFILVYTLSLMSFKQKKYKIKELRWKYLLPLTLGYFILLLSVDLRIYSVLNIIDNVFLYNYYEIIFYLFVCVIFVVVLSRKTILNEDQSEYIS